MQRISGQNSTPTVVNTALTATYILVGLVGSTTIPNLEARVRK